MLSFVSYLLLIQFLEQFHSSSSLETIQAALASTIELPCSIGQNIEPTNLAKIIWIRDDHADIVSLDSVITVRDRRLSILATDSIERQERTLRINNLEEQDHGLYRCVRGDTTINEIFLDVLIPPRIISHSPEHMHLTVREGRDARFSCMAFGRPVPVIVWHVNGLSRPALVNKTTQNESILLLRNVSRLDAGRVDCSASNTLSTVNRQFLLHVKYKPTVTIPFHVSYFRLYDSATITCRACALPSMNTFDFFRPRQAHPIIEGIKQRVEEVINQTCRQITITIALTDPTLFGNYVCRARNSIGISHAEFILKELLPSTKPMTTPFSSLLKSSRSTIISSSSSIRTVAEDESGRLQIGYSYKSNTMATEMIAQTNKADQMSTSISFIVLGFFFFFSFVCLFSFDTSRC